MGTNNFDDYVKTIERLEPDVYPIDASAFYASAAISLKRIADMMTADRKTATCAAGTSRRDVGQAFDSDHLSVTEDKLRKFSQTYTSELSRLSQSGMVYDKAAFSAMIYAFSYEFPHIRVEVEASTNPPSPGSEEAIPHDLGIDALAKAILKYTNFNATESLLLAGKLVYNNIDPYSVKSK